MKDLDDGGEANEGSDGEGGEVNSNEFKIERRKNNIRGCRDRLPIQNTLFSFLPNQIWGER